MSDVSDKLSASDFPISPTRDPSLPSFAALPLSLSQFDSDGNINCPPIGAVFPTPPLNNRSSMKASYTSFRLNPEHMASPLFMRRKKEAPLPPPKWAKPDMVESDAVPPLPPKPVKPVELQVKQSAAPSSALRPVCMDQPKTKKSENIHCASLTQEGIVSQVRSALAEMVGENTQESQSRWNVCGITEPLLSEFSCKCVVMAGTSQQGIRGYLMVSDNYLCFVSTFVGDSRVVHRAVIPFFCVSLIKMGQTGTKLHKNDSIDLATTDGVMHTFYGFKRQFTRAINVLRER
ncbi:hypothetical protein PROFUN_02478 [Planoprotostelium fungivorum]|uniref:GRAM domain-containing protein n=1 Tax=Planoprotostelium fungivorum TaxID=1890364 RepID=A0A2P6MP22_9EUKA|nr:hypothetical protein PROFUN_02478 [Planoprotostelium fungivorum]